MVEWLLGRWQRRPAYEFVGRMAGGGGFCLIGWLADWLTGSTAEVEWLVGWLSGWIAEWLVGWLSDWLAG